MKKLVIIPGGFHPFHAGHADLYQQAKEAFPSADVYVAATDDRSERPFPFAIKKKLAQLAGIPPHRFIQVKSPFKPDEITSHYPENDTQLIFVKSEKNAKGGPDPEGPFPAERDANGNLPLVTRGANKGQPVSDRLQYYKRNGADPMSKHIYLKYLPVHEFNGMTSGSEIRAKWLTYDDATKAQLINLMYPATVGNDKLTDVTVKLMDQGINGGTVPQSQACTCKKSRT
jgi:cytidyltransferase-like protein